MHELVRALHAIWRCWYEGEKLDFRGEFYTHTLMTPAFSPRNTEHGMPRVFVAAVGPQMTQVAAEVADGMIAHPFTTERYLREVTLPAIARGLARAGKRREQFTLTCPLFIALRESSQRELQQLRQNIAFYGSTPAYRGVLELHGWGGLQDELNALSKRGQWREMGERIDDEVLQAFAVVGSAGEIAPAVRARYGDLLDRIALDVRGAAPGLEQELRAELSR
jgi:probable F420-dependent oxidoreductase